MDDRSLYQSPLVDEEEVRRRARRDERVVHWIIGIAIAIAVLVLSFTSCGERHGPPVDNSDDPGTYIPGGP